MGLLMTKEEWRGKGLAKKCVQALEEKLVSLGITPYCYIEDYNKASMGLYKKLGYEKTHQIYWIVTSPKNLY